MAILIDTKPYLRTLTMNVSLPRGNPIKHGNLVFLLSHDVNESVEMINNSVISHNNNYYYYYYDKQYSGYVYTRKFIRRQLAERKDAYELVSKKTKIHPHPMMPLNKSQTYNTYFDMSYHIRIFFELLNTKSVARVVTEYLKYFKSIVQRSDTNDYHKMVLINAESWKFTSSGVSDLCRNPVFIIYYSLYKYYDLVKDLDLDFFLYCGKSFLKINPSQCDEKSYMVVRRELSRLMSKASKIDIDKTFDDTALDKSVIENEVSSAIQDKYNFTGDNTPTDAKDAKPEKKPTAEKDTTKSTSKPSTTNKDAKKEDIPVKAKPVAKPHSTKEEAEVAKKSAQEKIEKTVAKVSKNLINELSDDNIPSESQEEMISDTVKAEMNEDPELIKDLYTCAVAHKVKTSPISSARDAALRQKQGEIKVKDMTLADIDEIKATDVEIEAIDVSAKMHSGNKNMGISKMANFEKSYNENCMNKDILSAFTSLNNKALPMFIISTEVTDTSDPLNYKETWRVTLEDSNRQRHTITVDIPKFIDDKFLYLGGNKKTIVKQNYFYPVVKTGPDEVQIVTNYNKVFIYRNSHGSSAKTFSNIERLTKLYAKSPEAAKLFRIGNAYNLNTGRISTIEFDELSKYFYEYKSGNTIIYFSRENGDAAYPPDKVPDGYMFIGMENKKPILINVSTQTTDDGRNIVDIISENLTDDLRSEYMSMPVGKRLLFNIAKIMGQYVSLISLLGYWEGLTTVLKKAGISYTLSDKRVSPTHDTAVIKFADCYLSYKNTIEAQLLMNGINVFDTKLYNFSDFDEDTPYIDYFRKVYGKASIVNALTNAYEFTLDPITLEILKDMKLPEDIVSLFIHASNLLADNDFTGENKQWMYRIRSNEIIPAILYDSIAKHYIDYRNSAGRHKLSVPRDAVIKQLLALQTVEDYSVLNPVVDAYKTSLVSCKGFRGLNLDDSYDEEKRSYDPSMMGIMAISTSPDSNCGINRELTWEPSITNARGYVEIKPEDELKDVNLFSVSELVTSLGVTRDDSIRTSMAGKQTRHVIPTKNSAPVLISNGAEEAIKYKLGSDFVVNAEEDGEVVEFNTDSNIMIVKYKSGKHKAIDLSSHVVKNGMGGFYLSNQLVSDYSVGDKFKANDTLAYHKDYFTSDPLNGVRMNIGVLTKVAIMSSYNTYQDGSICTHKLSEAMSTDMIFPDKAVVGKNSNIEFIAKVGDHVEVGDPLIQFDESFEESELNKFLKSLGDDMREEVGRNARNVIKASHPGKIKNIEIYSTIELDEMSPTLRDVVSKYYDGITGKKSLLDKYDKTESVVKCGMLFTDTVGKVEPNAFGVIKGTKVEDGVLVIFYIEHGDNFGVGDKAALFTANKIVCDELVPKGYEPYSEYRPDEEVSILVGESAILKRMVPSIVLSVLGNKVLVELKNKLREIYES